MPVSHLLLAFVMAFITSGFASLVSHAATLMVPSVLILIVVISAWTRTRGWTHPLWMFAPVTLILVAILSANQTNAEIPSLIHAVGMFVPWFGLAMCTRQTDRIMRAYILMCSALLIGMVAWLAVHLEEVRAWQISGVAGCGNLVACQINMVLPLLILYSSGVTETQRRFMYSLVGVGALCVILIMSRSGVASLLCCGVLLLMINHRRIGIPLATVIVGLAVFKPDVLHNEAVHEVLQKFRLVSYEPTYARGLIWDVAGDAWAESPLLGVGPGNASHVLGGVGVQVNHAHNNVLQLSLEMGSIAGGLLLAFSIYAGIVASRLILGGREDLLCGLSLLPYLVYSITASPIQHPEMSLLLVFCFNNARLQLAERTMLKQQRSLRHQLRPVLIPRGVADAWS